MQYSDTFAANLVDARMLEHLSKKELEKYLGVTRKFHQASVVHGIHLLRIMKYDRQVITIVSQQFHLTARWICYVGVSSETPSMRKHGYRSSRLDQSKIH